MAAPPLADPEPDDDVCNAQTFEAFYRQEFPRMVTLACAVSGSRLIAEDIAQDALLQARQHWDTVSRYDKPGAWLRRVTIQLAGKRSRRNRAEAAALLRLRVPVPIPPGPDEVEDVLRAIARLPVRQRAAVVLCYLEDRPGGHLADLPPGRLEHRRPVPGSDALIQCAGERACRR